MLKISAEGVQETVTQLRKFEPELYKQMQRDIKSEPGLQEAMSGIRNNIPAITPLSGMNHNGRTSYQGARVKPASTPSARLDRGSQRTIVRIDTVSPSNGIGFEIIDMVGRGRNANSAKARGMQSRLGGSPSRYVWKGFEQRREGINKAIVAIIERYSDKVNTKLRIF
jgi:hypothetical protein